MSHRDVIVGFLAFALELVLFYYLWNNNLLLAVSLAIVSFLALLKWANKEERILYFVGFVLGPIYDLLLVPAGVWRYGNPSILNVPVWIPFAYGLGIVIIVKIGKNLIKLTNSKQVQ